MKKAYTLIGVILIAAWVILGNFSPFGTSGQPVPRQSDCKEIVGIIGKGETMFNIFKKLDLDIGDLFKIGEASASIHRLRKVEPGRPYRIVLNDKGIKSFDYWIDDDSILSVNCEQGGFCATRKAVNYEKRMQHLGGTIGENLVSSIGDGAEHLLLALKVSDIFAWDIDFTSDLRSGDTFKIVVEGLYLNGEFRKYGDILSVEFINDGETYRAYRFGTEETADYYDAEGKSLRRAFLKAPLNFRRVSSEFSKGRFHPILKISRPHHGLDYAASAGTPVSAVGGGTVLFAGRKGQYGNLVIIKHPNGWKTYYGHLSKIGTGVKRGVEVDQGMMIGRVGSTGMATGPHLHYEIRIGDRPVNPLEIKLPQGDAIPGKLVAEFGRFKNSMDMHLGSMGAMTLATAERKK